MPISKNKIKELNSLKIKKYRQDFGLFTCEGIKSVKCLLNSKYKVREIYANREFLEQNIDISNSLNIEIVSDAELQKISNLSTPQQVFAVVEMQNSDINTISFYNKITLILDNIQDPGNLGTIIRLADWFGIENIVCSENSVDVYNPKVIQSTMGSVFALNIFYTNLIDFFQQNHQIEVFGTFMNAESLNKVSKTNQLFLLMGNEANGISKELNKYITKKISIPSFNQLKMAESLNVANATAICLWEICR